MWRTHEIFGGLEPKTTSPFFLYTCDALHVFAQGDGTPPLQFTVTVVLDWHVHIVLNAYVRCAHVYIFIYLVCIGFRVLFDLLDELITRDGKPTLGVGFECGPKGHHRYSSTERVSTAVRAQSMSGSVPSVGCKQPAGQVSTTRPGGKTPAADRSSRLGQRRGARTHRPES